MPYQLLDAMVSNEFSGARIIVCYSWTENTDCLTFPTPVNATCSIHSVFTQKSEQLPHISRCSLGGMQWKAVPSTVVHEVEE